MSPREILRKSEMLTAEIEYSARTVSLLSGFEELHREMSRDPRLDPDTREAHQGISLAMGDQIKDALHIAQEMRQARSDLQNRLNQTPVGELYANADLRVAGLWLNSQRKWLQRSANT